MNPPVWIPAAFELYRGTFVCSICVNGSSTSRTKCVKSRPSDSKQFLLTVHFRYEFRFVLNEMNQKQSLVSVQTAMNERKFCNTYFEYWFADYQRNLIASHHVPSERSSFFSGVVSRTLQV